MSGTQRYALFVLIVVIAAVVYLVVSGGLDDLIGGGSSDNDEQAAAELSELAVLRADAVEFGEPALVGDIEVSVQSISFPEQIRADGIWRNPAERFATVQLTITNRSKQAIALPIEGLQLVTSDGRAYLADAGLSSGAARVTEGVAYAPPLILQPQLTITVVAVYDIPLDAGGLQLRVSGGWTDFALFE